MNKYLVKIAGKLPSANKASIYSDVISHMSRVAANPGSKADHLSSAEYGAYQSKRMRDNAKVFREHGQPYLENESRESAVKNRILAAVHRKLSK